jgi:hypothetical protein
MGRKSPLSEKQWAEIEKRLLSGESGRALAREFGVAESAIRKRFGAQPKQIKAIANQVIAAEIALKALPISAQISAQNLINELRAVSMHLAGAAKYGAASAHRLAGIAHDQVQMIDDAEPEKSMQAIQRFGALTKLANDASHIGVNLLAANKDRIKRIEDAADEQLGDQDDDARFIQTLARLEASKSESENSGAQSK